MDWIAIVLTTFKVPVFGTCMCYAIKSHYLQVKPTKVRAISIRASTAQVLRVLAKGGEYQPFLEHFKKRLVPIRVIHKPGLLTN